MKAASAARILRLTLVCGCLAASVFLTSAALGGEIHGGIEIGGKGIKATAVEVTGAGDNIDFQVKLADTTNTGLAGALSREGQFEPAVLARTVAAVKKYHDRFRNELGVAAERIRVVGSSGLFAAIHDKPELIDASKKRLSDLVKQEAGLSMTFIDARREAELSIVGILPRSKRTSGILIDVGGGNTKGGYPIEAGQFATFSIPFGTVTFAELARKKNATDPSSLARLGVETLEPLLKKQLGDLPDVGQRDHVYLSGGVVWAVATFARPTESRAYTPLTLKDVEDFEAKLLAANGAYPELDVSGVADPQRQRRMLAEAAKVKKVYAPAQLLAGIQVLKNTLRAFGTDKHYYFARHGSLGWILAYVTESARGDKP